MTDSTDSVTVTEDGTLKLGDSIECVTFHPTLNVFILTTKDNEIHVFDPHTSQNLLVTSLKGHNTGTGGSTDSVQCFYSPYNEGIFITSGNTVGFRKEHQGIICFDTALQKQVSNSDHNVFLEMPRNEALVLYETLKQIPTQEYPELKQALREIFPDDLPKNNDKKYSKWQTETIKLPWSTFENSCIHWMQYFQSSKEYFPSWPSAAMLLDRVNRMLASNMDKPIEIKKENMFSEAVRLSTFREWPHMDYKWALPEQMAQAGFFHQPGENNDDRAMCFICNVCLVFWEPTDEPWSEHERHSPGCRFVRGEYTQNVPLSYSYALSPAQSHVGTGSVSVVSSGNCPSFVATSTGRGSITLWSVSSILKREAVFWIDLTDSVLMDKHFCDADGFCDIALGDSGNGAVTTRPLKVSSWVNNTSAVILDLMDSVNEKTPESYENTSPNINPEVISNESNMKVLWTKDVGNSPESEIPLSPSIQTDAIPISKSDEPLTITPNDTRRDSNLSESQEKAVATKNTANIAADSKESVHDARRLELTSENLAEKLAAALTQELYVPPRGSQDIKINALCVFVPPKEGGNVSSKGKSYLAVGVGIRKFMLPPKSVSTPLPFDMEDDLFAAGQKQHITIFTPYILMYGLNVIKHKKAQKQKKAYTPSSSIIGKSSESSPVDELLDSTSKTLPSDNSVADIISPTIQQCVELPKEIASLDVYINNITATPCGRYLVVTVRDNDLITNNKDRVLGALLVYRIIKDNGRISIDETPVKKMIFSEPKYVPAQILQISNVTEDNTLDNILLGYVSINGDVGVFSLNSMSCIFHKEWEGEPYTHIVYCASLERLCAVKKNGTATLLIVTSKDQSYEDDASLRVFFSDLADFDKESSVELANKNADMDVKNLLVHQDITEANLDKCLLFTQLQCGSPRFVATVLPCYSEVIQAQKQRKSPQHLQFNALDISKSSRTWKLEPTISSEKEHVIGILFPSNGTAATCGFQFGYVDVKVVFASNVQNLPKIQVTLLKQILKIGNYIDRSKDEDTDGDQLNTHNTEILDGPIDATEFINPSDNTSTIVLTSPLLMACRSRNYVIHIKSLPVDDTEIEMEAQKPETSTHSNGLAKNPQPVLKGCNVIKEISVSFKAFKKTKIPRERLQRLAMLEKTSFHEALLSNAIHSPSFHIKNRCLDLFFWILTVHSSSRSSKIEKPSNIFGTLLSNIGELIRNTILLGDRALAHKTAKILATAIDYFGRCSNRAKSSVQILDGLLDCHLDMMECKSAGALFYYFTLLNSLKHFDPEKTARKATALLSRVVPLLEGRDNPLHTLLHSKFNLQGLPFEREIFDSQLLFDVKLMSRSANAKNPLGPNLPPVPGYNPVYPNCSKGLSGSKNQVSTEVVERVAPDSPAACGLLEVEPLHFALHMASDGTKMEKVFPGSSYGGNPLFMQPPGNNSPHANVQQPEDQNYSYSKGVVNLNKNSAKHKLLSKVPKEDASTATSSEYTSDGSINDAVMEGATSDEEEYLPIMPMGYQMPQNAMDLIMEYDVGHSQHLPSTLPGDFQSGDEDVSKKIPRQVLSPHMLSLPPQHILLVDRMHSGSRRFAVLDFGRPIVLTDILIPACSDLVLISVDTWLTGEEIDGDRLTVFHDIATKPLSMVDLQPPVVCRYLKLRLIGRQGMLNTQCRVPVGCFFGHTVILPWHLQAGNTNMSVLTKDVAMSQQPILANMVEDLSCRYSLACSTLKKHLEQALSSVQCQNSTDLGHSTDSDLNQPSSDSEATQSPDKHVFQAYQECLLEQKHLNLVLSVLSRMNHFLGFAPHPFPFQQCSTDQLNTLVRYSLNCLLTLTVSPSESKLPASLIDWGDAKQAYVIIENICLRGSRGPQVEAAAALLSRLCSSHEWWGEFLCDTLFRFFEKGFEQDFSNIRAFTLITLLAFKSCEAGHGSDLVNSVVLRFLSLFKRNDISSPVASLQVPSLRWILLFLCECLEVLSPTLPSTSEKIQYREPWSWMNGETLLRHKNKDKGDSTLQAGVYRDRLCKRVSYHKQKLLNLDASKSIVDVLADLGTWGSNPKVVKESEAAFNKLKHQHYVKHFKDLCSIKQHENASLFRSKNITPISKSTSASTSATPSQSPSLMRLSYNSQATFVPIDRGSALQACKLLIEYILTPPPIEVDSFILVCRVVGGLMMATRPCLRLSEILSNRDLENLLCQTIALDTASGRPWALHAVTCMLRGAIIEEKRGCRRGNRHEEALEKETVDLIVEEAKPVASPLPCERSPTKSVKLENAKSAIHTDSNGDNLDKMLASTLNQLATSNSPPPVSFAYCSNEFCFSCDDTHMPFLEESSDDDYMNSHLNGNKSNPGWCVFYQSLHGNGAPNTATKQVPAVPRAAANHLSCSPTCDLRLENGFSYKSELNLSIYNGFHRDQLNIGLTEPLQLTPMRQTREDHSCERSDLSDTRRLLAQVFEKAMCSLAALNDFRRLEMLMEMWLHVNLTPEHPTSAPGLKPNTPLTPKTVSSLLAVFSRSGRKTVKSWFLLFHILSCCCHTSTQHWSAISSQDDKEPLIWHIMNDKNLPNVIVKFLNGDCYGTGNHRESRNDMAGASLKSYFNLFMKTCIAQASKRLDDNGNWKKVILTIVIRLLEDNGAFCTGSGPLDAQEAFLQSMRLFKVDPVEEKDLLMSLIRGIAYTIYNYASNMDEVTYQANDSNSSLLGGLFASVLGSENRQGPPVSREVVLCWLINIAVITLSPPEEVAESKKSDDVWGSSEGKSWNEGKEGRSDEEPSNTTEASTTESHVTELINSVVLDEETMDLFLQALSKLNGSSILFSLKGNLPLDIPEKLGLRGSVIDALYRLLLHIYAQTSSIDVFVQSLLRILQPRGPWCVLVRSEALFWYLAQILEQPNILKKFTDAGGFKILWQNLLQASKQIGAGQMSEDQRGLVSSVMNHLNPQLPPVQPSLSQLRRVDTDGTLTGTATRRKSEVDAVARGLYNFAPIANITSTNHTSRPAEALVRDAPFFPRTKNPQWSYHFFPNEKWIDLKLALPCAILLHEVHLQPHSLSLGMSPAAVTVETSLDGHIYYPATGQIIMAGLSYVKVEFPQPIITCSVRLRLGHPLEQSTVGLAQIRMYGTTALKSLPMQSKLDSNQVESSSKASAWWLRLIEHCLCNVEGGLQMGVKCALEMDSVIPTLVSLLTASTSCVNTASVTTAPSNGGLENIALSLAKADNTLLEKLLTGLLTQPLFVHSLGNAVANAPISLLFNICCNEKSTAGMALMLEWLHKSAELFIKSQNSDKTRQVYVTPVLLGCIAASLWSTKADVSSLLPLNLFRDISTWRDMSLGTLKSGLNQILCSMCKIKPIFFVQTLWYMGILVEDTAAEHQDSMKENKFGFPACCSDDTKGTIDSSLPDLQFHNMYLPDARSIPLSGGLLRDLANVCQSYEAANLLLDSGFLNLLVQGILAWCKKELLPIPNDTDVEVMENSSRNEEPVASTPCMDTALVADSLEAFNTFAAQLPLKEWLGSGEGSTFWLPLLTVLGDPTVRAREDGDTKDMTHHHTVSSDYIRLEDATVKLMRECVLFHVENQKILASTLCHLIQKQKIPPSGGMTYLHSLSGFTRRLVLQVLLDVEFVTVLVNTSQGVLNISPAMCSSSFLPHSQDGLRQHSRVLHLPASTTIEQVLDLVTVKPGSNSIDKSSSKAEDQHSGSETVPTQGLNKIGLKIVNKLYETAGVPLVLSKDKKHKCKSSSPKSKTAKKDGESTASETSKKSASDGTKTHNAYGLCHSGLLGGCGALPSKLTLSQVLSALRGAIPSNKVTPWLRFTLLPISKCTKVEPEDVVKLYKTEHFPFTLETFTSLGGLSLLAQHMALLYPDTSCQVLFTRPRSSSADSSLTSIPWHNNHGSLNDFVLVDSPIPPHSLGAFTLFLRLPGYAQALLTNPKNACCLLRLAFGANNVSDTGRESASKGYSLATLPFQVLEGLLSSTPNSTDDGRMLRKMCLKVGALNLILACLAALSHQDSPEVIATLHHPNVPIGLVVATTRSSAIASTSDLTPAPAKSDPERCHYWAKGTGFGTGSTSQTWNVEHAIQRQQMEEQHIVWLLRLLAQYVNPVPTEVSGKRNQPIHEKIGDAENSLPEEVFLLFKSSGLISKIASYLSNDSVLDMSRHIPLYKALMDLIVAIGVTRSINSLLIHMESGSEKMNLPNLLASMMKNVDTYMSKLRVKRKPVKSQKNDSEDSKDEQDEEGLSYLVPYMRQAANLVEHLNKNDDGKRRNARSEALELLANGTTSAIYEQTMKELQFDSYEMIVENVETNDICFTVPYNYETAAKNVPALSFSNKRLKRLAQEVVTLSSSLPLSFSSSVFARTDIDRIDVMKVLITGPEETPYANGCFEFDIFFPADYPQLPLSINLQTTGDKKVRFNPNLYQDGKVCLSILNTWHGRPEEKWSPHTSSLLQVLVSIQSLILVSEPYFNEPGYERARGTPVGVNKSREYDANIRVATIRYAILNQLRNPSPCFKEVIERHFWIKRFTVLNQIDEWIRETEGGLGIKNLATHLSSLKKLRSLVDEELKKLDPDSKPSPPNPKKVQENEKEASSPEDKGLEAVPPAMLFGDLQSSSPSEKDTSAANGVFLGDWSIEDPYSDNDNSFMNQIFGYEEDSFH